MGLTRQPAGTWIVDFVQSLARIETRFPDPRRMPSSTQPADRTGTIGVESFDAAYGAGFQAEDDSPHALDCELVEDAGVFAAHRPEVAARPRRVAFVDGTMRTEARLTYTGPQGEVSMGLAGSWAAGAVLVTDDGPARFERIAVGRTAIIRHRRSLPFIGYVKTHHRRLLAPDLWLQVPGLSVGERSGLFALPDDLYACYLRVGDPGPWAGPWAGIARIEVPAGIGLATAVAAVDDAAGWLPAFASALHRDARAPVNLTPIAGLERRLHHLQGDARLALRAVRESVL